MHSFIRFSQRDGDREMGEEKVDTHNTERERELELRNFILQGL